MAAPLTLLALLIELMVGYPDRLVQSIGHPVTWMGRMIAWLGLARAWPLDPPLEVDVGVGDDWHEAKS